MRLVVLDPDVTKLHLSPGAREGHHAIEGGEVTELVGKVKYRLS